MRRPFSQNRPFAQSTPPHSRGRRRLHAGQPPHAGESWSRRKNDLQDRHIRRGAPGKYPWGLVPKVSFHGGLTGERADRASGEHRITARVKKQTLPAEGRETAYVQFAAPGVEPLRCHVAAFDADPTDWKLLTLDQRMRCVAAFGTWHANTTALVTTKHATSKRTAACMEYQWSYTGDLLQPKELY